MFDDFTARVSSDDMYDGNFLSDMDQWYDDDFDNEIPEIRWPAYSNRGF